MNEDFRKAAEARARSRSPSPVRHPLGAIPLRPAVSPHRGKMLKSPIRTPGINNGVSRHQNIDPCHDENTPPNINTNSKGNPSTTKFNKNYNGKSLTPAHKDAELAAKDFLVNGDRAISSRVRPRWVLDEESLTCGRCRLEFDWMNRKHHCRYCGQIFCGACTSTKLLLPAEFGFNAPERVCDGCCTLLSASQSDLASGALHAQPTALELAPNSLQRYMNLPCSLSLGREVQKAAYSVYNMFHRRNMLHDTAVPAELLRRACGLVFLTVVKAGLFYGASVGSGILIRRNSSSSSNSSGSGSGTALEEGNGGVLSDMSNISTRLGGRGGCSKPAAVAARIAPGEEWLSAWSAPCAIQVLGVSCGLLVGCEVCDFVLFLNSEAAVDVFATSSSQFSLGAGLDVTVGLMGRAGGVEMCVNSTSAGPDLRQGMVENAAGAASSLHAASATAYGHSRGFYVGASVDSMWFSTRPDMNLQFYGRPVSAAQLLARDAASGCEALIAPPLAAHPLYEALHKVNREFVQGGGANLREAGGTITISRPEPPAAAKPVKKKAKKYRRVSILI